MKIVVSQAEFDNLSDADRNSGAFIVEPVIDKATQKLFEKDKYVDIKDVADVEKALALADYKIWTEFDTNSGGEPLPKLPTTPRRRYEAFCYGFLYFYDHQLYSNDAGKVGGYLKQLEDDHKIDTKAIIDYFEQKRKDKLLDHKIFFLWIKDKNRFPLKIYLNPGPGNPDPPGTPAPPPPETSDGRQSGI